MEEYNLWKKHYNKNSYYHHLIYKHINRIIEANASVIEFSTRGGEILGKLPAKRKLGVNVVKNFPEKNTRLKIISLERIKDIKEKFDYIVINNTLSEVADIQNFLKIIKRVGHEDSVYIVLSFNYLWKPLADLAELLKWKYPFPKNPNWLDERDISNFFNLENYNFVSASNFILLPLNIPVISNVVNKYLAPLPIINNFCLTNSSIYKNERVRREYSTSIVIPAKNEEGNIKNILKKIPSVGKSTEVIFVEGNSTDNTKQAIFEEIKNYKGKHSAAYIKQTGCGKGDAVRLGFKKAKGELLMILDADLTVSPKELTKFYSASVSGKGDLIMGSRFVYPMENQAMRTLNYWGNKIFSHLFSYLLGQTVKDTLCGTKVLFKKDYRKIEKGRTYFGDFDPFGDFDLIFGAKKLNLKILEIPVRYKDRHYGTTKISRFTHGWLLLKMSLLAANKFKFTL